MRVVAEAWRNMIVIAFGFALVVIWVHPLTGRRKARRAARVAEAEHLLAQGAIQSALDDAYALAEKQAPAPAECGCGLCGAMPSRKVVAACASAGEHDRLPISEHDRALLVAMLEAKFHHEERPPAAADTDPGEFDAW